MTHVVLLPLDDRPVNTGQVADLADAAGVRLTLPPPGMLGARGAASDPAAVGAWLERAARDADAVVVSLNQLVHGGYVPSRRTTESIADWLPRLEVLKRLPRSVPTAAFAVLTRTKNQDDAGTEPPYWAEHGRGFFRFSKALYGAEHGFPADVAGARAALPAADVHDWLHRRLAHHQLHLAGIELAAEGVLDLLAVVAEDTTVDSVSTGEREWLQTWTDRFDLGGKVLLYPGADEVGAVLFGRALTAGRDLTAAVVCEVPGGLDAVAVFEDVPVRETVSGQLRAAGLRETADVATADLVVAVHPPAEAMGDRYSDREIPASTARRGAAEHLAERVSGLVRAGRRVVVADVADANGSDPELVAALRSRIRLDALAGYAGWNTAGNSIGSAVAQGCAALTGGPGSTRKVLAHRFLEDLGYQSGVRYAVIDGGDPAGLADRLADFPEFADIYRVRPGSVRLPWGRPFEVDFTLEDIPR
ncbi:DUF4127 family protein [Rhizohabitans arisaemae]|uniref:DUF4127 family protein n=1 Tax=Rhizohabitans arisaemae TaxID=2720610 RepID=UPI0024B15F70|nr:DUF4127 family protein [Rhizohabitans arisaemae]